MAAVGRGDGAEAGQAIREHMRARLQMPLGPGCDGLSAEATQEALGNERPRRAPGLDLSLMNILNADWA